MGVHGRVIVGVIVHHCPVVDATVGAGAACEPCATAVRGTTNAHASAIQTVSRMCPPSCLFG